MVPVVEASEDGDGDEHRGTSGVRWGLYRDWRLATQALVWPGNVVVLLDELPHHPLEVSLTQHDHMVQQLSAERANEPFDVRILPRALGGCPHLIDAAVLQKRRNPVA